MLHRKCTSIWHCSGRISIFHDKSVAHFPKTSHQHPKLHLLQNVVRWGEDIMFGVRWVTEWTVGCCDIYSNSTSLQTWHINFPTMSNYCCDMWNVKSPEHSRKTQYMEMSENVFITKALKQTKQIQILSSVIKSGGQKTYKCES